MSKWYCKRCWKVFPEPERRWLYDDGASVTVMHVCPTCESLLIEEMERCPTCDGGWKMKGDKVCEKCHLRNMSEIRLFVHRFSPATLSDMDDILEGNGLEMFA